MSRTLFYYIFKDLIRIFLLTSGAVMDKLAEVVKGQKFEIISTNLTKEQEDKLRAELSEA